MKSNILTLAARQFTTLCCFASPLVGHSLGCSGDATADSQESPAPDHDTATANLIASGGPPGAISRLRFFFWGTDDVAVESTQTFDQNGFADHYISKLSAERFRLVSELYDSDENPLAGCDVVTTSIKIEVGEVNTEAIQHTCRKTDEDGAANIPVLVNNCGYPDEPDLEDGTKFGDTCGNDIELTIPVVSDNEGPHDIELIATPDIVDFEEVSPGHFVGVCNAEGEGNLGTVKVVAKLTEPGCTSSTRFDVHCGPCSPDAGVPEPCGGEPVNDCGGCGPNPEQLGEPCTEGVDACEAGGSYVCDPADPAAVVCDAEPLEPSLEVCDGINNDCDNDTDEELSRSCPPNICGNTGTQICVDGDWSGECPADPRVLNNLNSWETEGDTCAAAIDMSRGENFTGSCFTTSAPTRIFNFRSTTRVQGHRVCKDDGPPNEVQSFERAVFSIEGEGQRFELATSNDCNGSNESVAHCSVTQQRDVIVGPGRWCVTARHYCDVNPGACSEGGSQSVGVRTTSLSTGCP